MPGFHTGPLPQNYKSTSVPSETGYVVALVQNTDTATGWITLQVKNQFSVNTPLEFMNPEGMVPCNILALRNAKGETVETLHPGTQGQILLSEKVITRTNDAFFAFLVAKGQTKTH
jgi:putative protease